jgi:ribosomal protein RSM22 (predicted rRNA methylase)
MITAELPAPLAAAVRARFDIQTGKGQKAGAALSQRYRDAHTPPGPRARADDDIAAYALTRLPATYAAASATLGEVRARWQEFTPRSQLDLGAGLGAAAWAAAKTWASLEAVTAVELEATMLETGRSLAAAGPPAVARSSWRRGDASRELPEGSFDLVTIVYVLNELDPVAVVRAVEHAWAATAGALVIVEPGTPEGYRRIIAARALLLALGGFTVAPCPHDRSCPLGEADWCHFAVRLPRSREHRTLKSAQLGYEDEKFSYVVVAREPTPRAPARILRHPQVRGGHVRLELCAADGLREAVVSKRDGDVFRVARKASWGDAIDLSRPAESPGGLPQG